MQNHSRSDEFISDFCDAALFKEHPLFKNDKHALQIVAYYDEVETANCLGSHAGHNSKLGEFETNICNPICHRKHLSLFRYVLLHLGKSEARIAVYAQSNSTYSMCILSNIGQIWF